MNHTLPRPGLILTLLAAASLLSGCVAPRESEFGEMQWYMSNSTGSDMTMVVIDTVCQRTFFRVDLPRSGQVSMTTCQDSAGRSSVRYRRSSRIADGNPWRDAIMTRWQVLMVR